MKVLHVIGPMEVGGAQTQLLGLVRAGAGRYWDATVCSTSPGPMLERFRALGVPMFELERRASPGLGRAYRLRQFVSRGSFDVIHANLWQANAMARLAVVGSRHAPAVIISERGVEISRARARLALDRFLARWTDAYVGNSDAVTSFIREVHPTGDTPVLTIANAIDRSVFGPVPAPNNAVPRIGAIGRLEDIKGFDVLIDATRQLVSAGRAVEVEIAGVGPRADDLAAAARDLPIRLLGAVEPGPGVASFLTTLDLLVLPSRVPPSGGSLRLAEGRPNAVLEALARGVPVVATDSLGAAEALGEGGRLVPPGDAQALAKAIAEALGDPHARDAARRAGSVIPGFDHLARAYLDAWNLALEHRRRKSRRGA